MLPSASRPSTANVRAVKSRPRRLRTRVRRGGPSGTRLFLEQVTEPADRPDGHATALKLSPDAMHGDVQAIVGQVFRPVTHRFRELFTTRDAIQPGGQHGQHAEFATCEI